MSFHKRLLWKLPGLVFEEDERDEREYVADDAQHAAYEEHDAAHPELEPVQVGKGMSNMILQQNKHYFVRCLRDNNSNIFDVKSNGTIPTCRGRPRCPRSGRSRAVGCCRRRRMTEISMRTKLESNASRRGEED